MTTEINTCTAMGWLDDYYADVPGIWAQFNIEDAAESLVENTLDLRAYEDENFSYDDFTRLDLMCIMADARM